MANKEVIKKWVDALRSGEYKQTDGALRKEDGFCCLGVLCEVAVDEGVVDNFEEAEEETGEWPNNIVVGWAGLEDNDPVLLEEDEPGEECAITASQLNDDLNYSFKQIADLIERKYLTGE